MRKVRQGNTEKVTQIVGNTQGNTEYPAILHALTDPVKRRKLEKIHQSLKEHGVEKMVTYGYPYWVDKGLEKHGIPFDVVGDLLEATSA